LCHNILFNGRAAERRRRMGERKNKNPTPRRGRDTTVGTTSPEFHEEKPYHVNITCQCKMGMSQNPGISIHSKIAK
jgi:hypothetical protein